MPQEGSQRFISWVKAYASSKRRLFATLLLACLSMPLVLNEHSQSGVQISANRFDLISPEPTPIVYDRNGLFLTQIGHVSRDESNNKQMDYGYWPISARAERLIKTTLILEDRRFYSHPGVDIKAICRALWRNLTQGSRREGASTIAMQVARMQATRPRDLISKFNESISAIGIISNNGHEAVLAHYLRLAPYGNNSHGAAHAARYYFDRPVEDLSWAQAALLAAIPKSPGRMNILRESGLKRAVIRAHYAIDQLEKEGALELNQAVMAHQELAVMAMPIRKVRPETLHLALRYETLVREGKLKIGSEFDPRIEASVDLTMESQIAELSRNYLERFRGAGAKQVAVIVAKRGSNEVVADVGSSSFTDVRAGAFDYTRVTRSPGSALKPFVYALALDKGVIETTDLLDDSPDGASGVNNFDGQYLGPMTPRQALANSRNIPATNLLRRVGLENNFRFLHELGIHDLDRPADEFGISMAIGALPTKLEYLVRAYAAIADDGVINDLKFAKSQRLISPKRVMSKETSRLITSFLSDPQARLPSFPRYGPLEFPFSVALKTGTSQNYRDAWTIAFSNKYVVGVWLGRGDAGAMRALTGANSAAQLLHAIFLNLHNAEDGIYVQDKFPDPPNRVSVNLCSTKTDSCAQTLTEWVKPEFVKPGIGLVKWSNADKNIQNDENISLSIVSPEPNTHIWINPEQPKKMNVLSLKLAQANSNIQILWMVDDEPFMTADADKTVYWPMKTGHHKIQARLALGPTVSRPINVTIE